MPPTRGRSGCCGNRLTPVGIEGVPINKECKIIDKQKSESRVKKQVTPNAQSAVVDIHIYIYVLYYIYIYIYIYILYFWCQHPTPWPLWLKICIGIEALIRFDTRDVDFSFARVKIARPASRLYCLLSSFVIAEQSWSHRSPLVRKCATAAIATAVAAEGVIAGANAASVKLQSSRSRLESKLVVSPFHVCLRGLNRHMITTEKYFSDENK